MTCRAILGWTIAACCFFALPAWAVEYRLQVTNIERLVFSSYFDRAGASSSGQETMPRLETLLDNMDFATAAVLPGRELQLLEDPGYGGTTPNRVSALPATDKQSWTTIVWDGHPGEQVAFVVKSDMVAWQEVYYIAANPNGVLRRLTIGGPALFGGQTREVPEVFRSFLATLADQRTYVSWVQQHAKSEGGMSLVIGRRNQDFNSVDRVYMLITPPSEPHTFKVVIGWQDHDDRGTGGQKFDRMHWQP